MKNKTQINREIKEKQEELENLRYSSLNDSVVLLKKKELEEAMEEAQEKIGAVEYELINEIKTLAGELNEVEKSKEIAIPQKVRDFISAICRGIYFGYAGWRLKWVSPKEKFAIITCGGSTYSSGMTREYGATKHYLFDITKINDKGHNELKHDYCTVFKTEGRLSKEDKQKWIDYVTKEER